MTSAGLAMASAAPAGPSEGYDASASYPRGGGVAAQRRPQGLGFSSNPDKPTSSSDYKSGDSRQPVSLDTPIQTAKRCFFPSYQSMWVSL